LELDDDAARLDVRRHTKLLLDAGLTVADLNSVCVMPLPRPRIQLGIPVNAWEAFASSLKLYMKTL
jgi:hypothetical protein